MANDRYFMSRTSAVALLVDTRSRLVRELSDKPSHETQRHTDLIKDVERLLLDVRIGRTREFDMIFPSNIHVIVSD